MITDDEIRRRLRLPAFLDVTTELRLAVIPLSTSQRNWFTTNARLLDWLVAKGKLTEDRSPDAAALLEYIDDDTVIVVDNRTGPRGLVSSMSRAALSPVTKVTLISTALGLLNAVGRPVAMTAALKSRLADYRRVKSDKRVVTAAISDSSVATAITIEDLFPDPPATLGEAVEQCAAISVGWFAGRPQEGVQIPMNRVRRGVSGYYIDRAWSKTDSRTFDLPQHVIDAINRVADFLPPGSRHRIGVDPDHELYTCSGLIIPRLDTAQRKIVPGVFHESWLGRMLKRRVIAYGRRIGIRFEDLQSIVQLVTGKAMRRGRNASALAAGLNHDQHGATVNLRSRHLMMLYSDGVLRDASPIAEFVLGMFPLALRENSGETSMGQAADNVANSSHDDIYAA